MAEHLGKVNAPVMIGVGAAFDFHAGLKKQARSGCSAAVWSGFSPGNRTAAFMETLSNLTSIRYFAILVFLQLTGLKKFPTD